MRLPKPAVPTKHADGSNATVGEVDRYWVDVLVWGEACDVRLSKIAPLVTTQ